MDRVTQRVPVRTRPRPAPAPAPTWHTRKAAPASHQHVLCQPPLLLGQPAGHPQGEALLPEERVAAVPAPEGDDFSAVGQVGDERQLGVTGPAVHQRLCTGDTCRVGVARAAPGRPGGRAKLTS